MVSGPVLIDDRTGSKELAGLIRRPHEITRLEFGDFAYVGNGPRGIVTIGIERKTISDLIQSMTSGRMTSHQLPGMASVFDYSYVLVEGLWRGNPKTNTLEIYRGGWKAHSYGKRYIQYTAVTSFLNAIAIGYGVHIWRTGTMRESARWIDDTHSWWSKPWDKHSTFKQFHVVESPTITGFIRPSTLECMLKEVPGVGWDRARSLAEYFSTPLEVALASEQDLLEVPGIGKKVARLIKEAMG
jgi:ERCC4-type nuclease